MKAGFVYLDTSVALAHLLAEGVEAPDALWDESLLSSRLLEYEVWTRLQSRGLGDTHGELARVLLSGVSMLELVQPVVARAAEAFPLPVRTLDAMHLASLLFVIDQGQAIQLASYDARMQAIATALGVHLYPL